VAYRAGPTGCGLARALQAAGVGCTVAAPGKIERPAQDKIKIDQRAAERVLRLLMIDAVRAVRVPSVEEEALRDLVPRARRSARDLMRARQRLSKLLLRHDVRCEDAASTWTVRHRAWLRAQDLGGRRRPCCWTTSARSTRSSYAEGRSRTRSQRPRQLMSSRSATHPVPARRDPPARRDHQTAAGSLHRSHLALAGTARTADRRCRRGRGAQ
jgi:hypothetical protein